MSAPPPLIGGLRRRRSRRPWAAAAALALAALVALALAVGLPGRSSHHAPARARAATALHAASPPAPARSPIGLPLGTPPLQLRGIGAPAGDALSLRFRKPPRAGLLFNLDTGAVLWQRNPLARLRIASLDKMMTALLTVQAEPPNARVRVTRQAVDAAGSKVGVLPLGRHVRVESMLYGLLLPSGNDAAVALAQRVSGSVSAFVARMNAKAAQLGLRCTRYSSPSGYLDQGNFSCAADLAVLAHEDLAQPRLARVARSRSAVLAFPIKGGRLFLYNNNPLLIYRYPGLTGLKTGYTEASGRCLVATAQRRGVRLGVVLLHSPDPATQAHKLLDLGFERIYHQRAVAEQPVPAGA